MVFPHVRSPDEAALAVSFLREAGAEPWSAANREGDAIAMIMIEDPASLERVEETAAVAGIGVLACGIGSLRGALGGDREAAEAGTLEVLAHARRVGAADMITANTGDVEARVAQGFLALLMQGAAADEAIRLGRLAGCRPLTRGNRLHHALLAAGSGCALRRAAARPATTRARLAMMAAGETSPLRSFGDSIGRLDRHSACGDGFYEFR